MGGVRNDGGSVARTSAREVKRDQAGQVKSAANLSLRLLIVILIQYGIGIGYNLYGTAPTAKKTLNYFSNPLLAVHVILGTLIVLTSIGLVVVSVRTKLRYPRILSILALVCVIGAWASGSTFITKATNGYSMSMAMFAGAAILCLAVNVWMLSGMAAGMAAAAGRGAPVGNAPVNN